MKFFFLFILTAQLLVTSLLAQSQSDSLKERIGLSKNDTSKIDLYFLLCRYYQEDDPDSAIYYSKLSEHLAIKQNDKSRVGRSLQERAVAYDFKNLFDSCMFLLRKADSIYHSIHRVDLEAGAIGDMGVGYYIRGKYELALRHYLKSYNLMRQYSSRKDQAKMLNNIGLLYKTRKQFDYAIQYLQSALLIKKEINDKYGIVNATINLGSLYHSRDMYDSAFYYASEGLKLSEQLNSKKDILICKANMGAALVSKGEYTKAKKILLILEKEVKKNNLKILSPTFYESLANIFVHTNQIPEALNYYFKALESAKKTNNLESLASFHKSIARTYYKSNVFQKAYLHLDSSKVLTDSLMNENNIKQLAEMTAVYENNEKENRIQTLSATNKINESLIEARKKERNYFILSTLLFTAISLLAFKAYKNNQKKKNQLTYQNEIIEKSLHDKEILLKEIHHRVKNNLQLVSSLLSLQTNYIEDEKALDAVRESRNRVQSMALIHQNLYQDESLVNIEVKEYIENLCNYLFHSYNLHSDRITIEINVQPMQLDIDQLIPLGLILNELINNCLKYAFPDQMIGKIRVILLKENKFLKLGVFDNGIGIKDNQLHFEKNSFGHRMIMAFAKKMKAELKMFHEDGTKVELIIPLEDDRI